MSGFSTQAAMRVFADATNSATHMVKGDTPINFMGFHNWIWGDAAARRLMTFGGEQWDIPFQHKEGNRLKQVNPGGLRSLTRTDDVNRMSQRGVLHYADLAFVDREIEANEGLTTALEAGAWKLFYDRLYNVQKTKRQQAATTIGNDMERFTAGVPNFNTMENRSNQATVPHSLFALINEWLYACHGITTATGFTAGTAGTDYNTAAVAAGGRWTTKQGVTVNNADLLVGNQHILAPQQVGYSTIDGAVTNHFTAMSTCALKARYKAPPPIPNTMDSGIESKSKDTAKCWYTSLKGWQLIQATTLSSQDLWVTPSRVDPAVYAPQNSGIPIEWWEQMDTYAGYAGSTNTTLVTEGASDARGPRFILHDRDMVTLVAHRLNWFRKRIAAGEGLIPDRIGEYLDVEFNWGFIDIRTSGIVYPTAHVFSAY